MFHQFVFSKVIIVQDVTVLSVVPYRVAEEMASTDNHDTLLDTRKMLALKVRKIFFISNCLTLCQ